MQRWKDAWQLFQPCIYECTCRTLLSVKFAALSALSASSNLQPFRLIIVGMHCWSDQEHDMHTEAGLHRVASITCSLRQHLVQVAFITPDEIIPLLQGFQVCHNLCTGTPLRGQ